MKVRLSNRTFILLKRHFYVRESWSTEAAEGFNRTRRTTSQGIYRRLSNRTRFQDIRHRCPSRFLGKDCHRRPRRPARLDTHCSLGWRKVFQSGQNLHFKLVLLNDIHMATTNGLSTKWGRAYHGNATEHREQSEVEGTHDSMPVCRIVRRLNAKDRTRYLREVEKPELGRCED
jgi:hypothetical protein